MTDDDLDACREAFPALAWDWYFDRNGNVHGNAKKSGNVIKVERYYDVFQASFWIEDHCIGHSAESHLSDALDVLRRKMSALRDDLTAALGDTCR